MKRYSSLIVFLLVLCAAFAYFLLKEPIPLAPKPEAKVNTRDAATPVSKDVVDQVVGAVADNPVITPAKTIALSEEERVNAAPVEVVPLEEYPQPAKVEEVEEVEQTPTPTKTPDQVSAENMVRSLSEFVDVSTFCSAPFLLDGRKEVEVLTSVQELFDKATRKATDQQATYSLDSLSSVPWALARESDDELIKLCIGNRRYAKLVEFAERVGGRFGAMRITRTIGAVAKQEVIALAFNKEGKIIGFAD